MSRRRKSGVPSAAARLVARDLVEVGASRVDQWDVELYDLRLDPAEINNVYTVPVYDEIRRELATNLYLQLRERGDHSFAKLMAAMTDFDIPLVNTARSDLDEVTSD